MTIKSITFMSKKSAQKHIPLHTDLLISICDYNKEYNSPPKEAQVYGEFYNEDLYPYFLGNDKWEEHKILRLYFDDINEETNIDGFEYKLFNIVDSIKIFKFINYWKNVRSYRDLYIHCSVGISRSSGVAFVIGEYLKRNVYRYGYKNEFIGFGILQRTLEVSNNKILNKENWPFYNKFVYNILMKEF